MTCSLLSGSFKELCSLSHHKNSDYFIKEVLRWNPKPEEYGASKNHFAATNIIINFIDKRSWMVSPHYHHHHLTFGLTFLMLHLFRLYNAEGDYSFLVVGLDGQHKEKKVC